MVQDPGLGPDLCGWLSVVADEACVPPAVCVACRPCRQPANSPVSYTTNIPKCIANGEYLLRIQSLGIHNPGGTPQFYVSCAQVNVAGGGDKTPSATCLIPGCFKATDPGYTANVGSVPSAAFVHISHLLTARSTTTSNPTPSPVPMW